jgi:hypothetical protein
MGTGLSYHRYGGLSNDYHNVPPRRPGRHRHRSRTGRASARPSGQRCRLRELWAQYLEKLTAEKAIHAAIVPARAAYDAEKVRGDHDSKANRLIWERYGLDRLHDAWNEANERTEETVQAILEEEAEGLFGIVVKIAALPDGDCRDPAHDHEDAIVSALTEIDRLISSTFVSSFSVLHMDEDGEDGAVS